MGSRIQELMTQVRQDKAQHHCTHEKCDHNRQAARDAAEATLHVFRIGTDLSTEQLVEAIHGVVLWLDAFREYNAQLPIEQADEQVSLEDLQNAAKAGLYLLGEELITMQDMDIIT